MQPTSPHLIIQEGPEKGRELVIPEEGARIGRATENDISIADAAMSRFQCRMYFRDGFLHIMDLGSTNESLVNNKPVTDQALRYGDEILIGESTLKVLNDGLSGTAPATEPFPDAGASAPGTLEPEPAPIVFNLGEDEAPQTEAAPAAVPVPAEPEPPPAAISPVPEPAKSDEEPKPDSPTSALVDVDLGFGRKDEEEESGKEPGKRSVLPMILVAFVTMLVVLTVGLIVLMSTEPEQAPVVTRQDDTVQLYYERVVSGNGNISRYALRLEEDGTLHADIHDIREQRKVSRGTKIDEETLKEFREQLLNRQSSFQQLDDSYLRTVTDNMESNDITLVVNRQAKRVQTLNHPQPDAFTDLRLLIEGFARNHLGLSTHTQTPEELRALARDAWANAQNLYGKREVKNENLYQAIQKLREVKFLLQDLEPKPRYYDQALELEQRWESELSTLVNDLVFETNRSLQVGRQDQAAQYLRRILETYPDKSSTVYTQAYNNLVRLEQEMNR